MAKMKIFYTGLLLALLLALLPAPAHAQEPEPPLPDAPVWDEIPDATGYLQFIVPQCGDCNGQTAIMDPYEDAQFPELSWDIRAVFGGLIRWLLSGVSNLFRWLVCWLLQMLQHLANFLALLVNGLIWIGNFLWRFLVFAWLTLKLWFYAGWWLYELFREFWQDVIYGLSVIQAWIVEMVRLLLAALALVGAALLLLLALVGRIVEILAWIGAISYSLQAQIWLALAGTNIPEAISDTHTVYAIVRGALDAIFDSQIGWVLWLYIAMAYVAWVTWLAKFFGGDKA